MFGSQCSDNGSCFDVDCLEIVEFFRFIMSLYKFNSMYTYVLILSNLIAENKKIQFSGYYITL